MYQRETAINIYWKIACICSRPKIREDIEKFERVVFFTMRFTTRLMIGETTKTISMEEDDFLFQEEINERVS